MDILPAEIIYHICTSFLEPTDILKLSNVCKKLADICNSNSVWSFLFGQFYPTRGIVPEHEYAKIYFYNTMKLKIFIDYGVICGMRKKRGIITQGWAEELGCQEAWNWDPQTDPNTEWCETMSRKRKRRRRITLKPKKQKLIK